MTPSPVPTDALSALARTLEGRRFVALTGAGLSTESGIPDYRGPATRNRPRRPVQHHEFVTRPEVRVRYWARSMLGWPELHAARPNAGHHALVELEREGSLVGVITQNVDGLHGQAGTRRLLELHGALREVRCLDCGRFEARTAVQERLERANPWFRDVRVLHAPDGDADLDPAALADFHVVECTGCAGPLMPDVVFFGGSVPRAIVDEAFAWVDASDALLVVGSSLAVYSGYRFARRAAERGIPLCLVNLGETRADPIATLRVDAYAGAVLPALAARLARGVTASDRARASAHRDPG